jgi:hypothetical protein
VGAQAQQALGLGAERVADEIEVHAVLDALRLRHLAERDTRPAGAPVAGEQDRVLGSRVFSNLPPEDISPEPARVAASAQSKVTANSELLTVGIPFAGVGCVSVRQGLAWTAWRLTYRRKWRPGSGGVPAGQPGSDGGAAAVGAAAVGGDDRAGDVAGLGRGEEGDLAGLGGPGQQGRGAEGLDAVGGGPAGQDRSGGDGIDPDT